MVIKNHKFSTLATVYFVLDLIILISFFLFPWISFYVLRSSGFMLPLRLIYWAGQLGKLTELSFIPSSAISTIQTPMILCGFFSFLFYIVPVLIIVAIVNLIKLNEERFLAFSRVSYLSSIIVAAVFVLVRLFIINRIESSVPFADLAGYLTGSGVGSLIPLRFGFYIEFIAAVAGIIVPFILKEDRPNYQNDLSEVGSYFKGGLKNIRKPRRQERAVPDKLELTREEKPSLVELYSPDGNYKITSLPSTIGRDNDYADVVLTDPTVSRKHCQFLIYNQSMLLVQDLDSTHGTVLAGETLIPNKFYQVNDGDLIQLGNMTLTIRLFDPRLLPERVEPQKMEVGPAAETMSLLGGQLDEKKVDFNASETIDEAERTAILGQDNVAPIPGGRTKKIDYNGGESAFPTMAIRGGGHYFLINKTPFIVGSDENKVDYPLREVGISKQHFKIFRNDDKFFITDLNSTNGVRLNGSYIKPEEANLLKVGDTIILGEQEYTFEDA